jgi:Peptidase family M28
MLNGRLYRAACVPLLLALALAAFSLGSRPRPFTTTLPPDAFEGEAAFAELRSLAAEFPLRRPGSRGDEGLARRVASTLEGLGGTAGGGFSVHTYSEPGQTIDGERMLSTVVATRPGSTAAAPIVIVAHRDAAAPGSLAELSGTATLLELARVFASRETERTIAIVSTSGGSGGDAGAEALAADPSAFGLHGPFDAAIVLGDLASARARPPLVVPYSDGLGSAALQLQRTVDAAIAQQAGFDAGAPSTFGELAHLAFPLAVGEQGVLDAHGIPAVLVQASGERGPRQSKSSSPARAGVSEQRLEGLGRSVLSAIDALDGAPNVSSAMEAGVTLQRKTLPAWVLRLLVATLLAPAFAAGVDGLARARRRRLAVGRWLLWTLSCALPFLGCAVLAYALGWLGVLGAAIATPAPAGALPFDGRALIAVVAIALTFALSWLLWRSLLARLRCDARPPGGAADAAALAPPLVLLAVAGLAWLANPIAALLAVPALHLWLALSVPELRARRAAALALVAAGLLPLALLIGFYASQLGLSPGEVAWTGVLLLAGGHVGLVGAILWSVAFGCVPAAALVACSAADPPAGERVLDGIEVRIRGPLTYAGPGSLGGTESALRR